MPEGALAPRHLPGQTCLVAATGGALGGRAVSLLAATWLDARRDSSFVTRLYSFSRSRRSGRAGWWICCSGSREGRRGRRGFCTCGRPSSCGCSSSGARRGCGGCGTGVGSSSSSTCSSRLSRSSCASRTPRRSGWSHGGNSSRRSANFCFCCSPVGGRRTSFTWSSSSWS